MPDSLDRRHFVAGGLTLLGGLVGSGCGGGGGGGGTPSIDPGLTEPIGTASFNPDVVYFPETDPISFRRVGDNIVELTGQTPGMGIGKLLLLTAGIGFAGRITSIEVTPSGSRCQYEPVTLLDIFKEANFSYSGEIPADAARFVGPDTPGTSLTIVNESNADTRAVFKRTLKAKAGVAWPGKAQYGSLNAEANIVLRLEVDFERNASTGEFRFKFVPSIAAEKGKLNIVMDEMNTDKKTISKVSLEKSTRVFRKVETVITTPVVVPLGPVPITVPIKWLIVYTLSFEAELAIDATAKWEIGWTGLAACGAEYSSVSGWKNLSTLTGECTPGIPRIHGAVEADVSLLKGSINAYAYGMAGPKVEVVPAGLNFTGEYTFPFFEDRGSAKWEFAVESSITVGIGFRSWLSKYIEDIDISRSLTWFEREYKVPDSGVINGTIS